MDETLLGEHLQPKAANKRRRKLRIVGVSLRKQLGDLIHRSPAIT